MAQKPEGVKLKFGERADVQHIPANYDIEYLFDNPKILYELEKKIIEDYIEKVRLEELCKDPNKIKEVIKEISDNYIAKDYSREDHTLIDEAVKENIFKKKLHSLSSIIFYRIAFVSIILLEMVLLIFIGMAQGGGFNYMIIFYGFLILAGSWLIGDVFGDHIFKEELGKMGKLDKTYLMSTSEFYIKLILGFVLILFVATVRAYGAGSPGQMAIVFLLTVVLALVGSVFEGVAHKFAKLNKWAIDNQVQALRKHASYLHSLALKRNEKAESEDERTSEYERFIKHKCQEHQEEKENKQI